MGNFLKKNWFVAIVAALLLGVSIFYIYDTNKGKLRGKSVNGEDVVFSVAEQDVTTSAFYDELYESGGSTLLASLIEKTVLDQSIETTEEMREEASAQAPVIRQNYMYQYSTQYESVLGDQLIQMGYSGIDDLEQALIDQMKLVTLQSDYAKEHFDELQIRNVSYILVQFSEDSEKTETPNEDEQKRMDAVDAAFAKGDDFATVATNHSEDPSTAPTGGVLGTIDNNTTSLDQAFLDGALALKEGEVSDWIYSSNFGFFKIKNNASTYDSLEAFVKAQEASTEELEESIIVNPIEDLVTQYDTTLLAKALWEKAESLGIDFHGDAELEERIKTVFGVLEESE